MKNLNRIVEKYNLNTIQDKIESLNNLDEIKIAFLGEFSSGKSSLLNKILEDKVLPTADKPTSKTIVEIIGSEVEKKEAYQLENKEIKQISLLNFIENSTTPSQNKLFVKVPMNDFFRKGYVFVDTPGLISIDKMDTDITFGYLPFLDGAVICQDIQKGSLSKSIKEFLQKPEIKPILNNFVFAITKSDTMKKENQEKVKNSIIEELKSLPIKDVEKKVVLVSINEDIDEFKEVVKNNIFTKKIDILNQRKEKEFQTLKQEVIQLLEEHKKDTDLDFSEIETKESNLKQEIKNLQHKKTEIDNKFNSFKDKLEQNIKMILESYKFQITEAKNEEELEVVMDSLQQNIQNSVNELIGMFFKDNINVNINDSYLKRLSSEIQTLMSRVNIGKMVGTGVLTAIIFPAAGAANVVEAGGGVVVAQTAKEVVKQQIKKSLLKEMFSMINKLNPMEHLGNFIQSKLIVSKLEEQLNGISLNIAFSVIDMLEMEVDKMFDELVFELDSKRELIDNLLKEKNNKIDKFNQYIKNIDEDILLLKAE